MKTLHLPLKREWYEMIERGEKKEEYRELKPYWMRRLLSCYGIHWIYEDGECSEEGSRGCASCLWGGAKYKKFDAVRFSYGYTRRTMTFEVESITIGKGRPEWGAPEKDVFIIKLGKRL